MPGTVGRRCRAYKIETAKLARPRYSGDSAFAWMARVGYVARGVVFILIAGFAGLAALGSGDPKGTRGALQTLLVQPAGELLLWLIAGGLLCFAGWRFVEAIFDPDRNGRQLRGASAPSWAYRRRGLSLIIASLALSLVFGLRGDDDKAARDWTAWLLAQPFGQWATVLVGIGIISSGIGQIAKPLRVRFRKQLAPPGPRVWAVALGVIGSIGRAAVFVIIGIFLIVAALRFNSGEASGFAGALRTLLQQQPYGSILLGITALGLLAFGSFQCIEAVWRRIEVPKVQDVAEKEKKMT
jgi:Domain of Unknown Function (DUF1206)